jgi:hypothetical protein
MFQKSKEEINNKSTSSSSEDVYIGLPNATQSLDPEISKLRTANQSYDLSQTNSKICAITQKARNFFIGYENRNQVEQADKILTLIEQVLEGNEDLNLPEFHVTQGDDSNVGLSWRVDNDLLGISIDQDPNNSSFFLLVGKQDNALRAYGSLYDKIDLDLLIDFLVNLLSRMRLRQQNQK